MARTVMGICWFSMVNDIDFVSNFNGRMFYSEFSSSGVMNSECWASEGRDMLARVFPESQNAECIQTFDEYLVTGESEPWQACAPDAPLAAAVLTPPGRSEPLLFPVSEPQWPASPFSSSTFFPIHAIFLHLMHPEFRVRSVVFLKSIPTRLNLSQLPYECGAVAP